jgi:homoserine kinase type II
MAKLTNLLDADIAAISDIYDLEIKRCQPIDGGDENSSFLLNMGSQACVLTFYEKRSLSGGEQQAELLRYLEVNGFPTNRVLPTSAGSYVPRIQGKPMILKTWIEGETLRDTEQSDFKSIGRSMAQLHAIPAPDFMPGDHPYGLKLISISFDKKVDREYEAWLADKFAYLRDNFPEDLSRALIHGDLFDDNLIYHQGRFQAIIDFGDACHYTRAYDLGSVLFGACMVDGRLDLERAIGVLEGYQSRTKLEEGEQAALQFFAVYAGAAISAWHYLHTYLGKPAEKRLDKYRLAAARTDHLSTLSAQVFASLLK